MPPRVVINKRGQCFPSEGYIRMIDRMTGNMSRQRHELRTLISVNWLDDPLLRQTLIVEGSQPILPAAGLHSL